MVCDNRILNDYLDKVIIPYKNFLMDKILLIMDSCTSHISTESLENLKRKEIDYLLISKGMKPELQLLDITVNKVFKEKIINELESISFNIDNLPGKVKLGVARKNLIEIIDKI